MLKLGKGSAVVVLGVMLSLLLVNTAAFAQSVNSSNTVRAMQSALITGTMQGVTQVIQDHQRGGCPGGTDAFNVRAANCGGIGCGFNCGGVGCGFNCGGVGCGVNCGIGCGVNCGPTWTRRCSSDRVCHTSRQCIWTFGHQACRTRHWCETIRHCFNNGVGFNNWNFAWVRPHH